MPDRVKRSFVIFDNRALWPSKLSVTVPVWHKMLYGNSGRQNVKMPLSEKCTSLTYTRSLQRFCSLLRLTHLFFL